MLSGQASTLNQQLGEVSAQLEQLGNQQVGMAENSDANIENINELKLIMNKDLSSNLCSRIANKSPLGRVYL